MVAPLTSDDVRAIGPYQLLRQLGRGRLGDVFLACPASGETVAVKVIRPELASDPWFRGQFRAEVAAARQVGGAFVSPVVDADADGDVPWLATAYVDGPTLAEAIRERGPVPAEALLMLASGLAEGLDAIHAAGLVHGNLHPSNVLLAEDGPRLTDFGIARAAAASAILLARRRRGTGRQRQRDQGLRRHVQPGRQPVANPGKAGWVPPGGQAHPAFPMLLLKPFFYLT